MKLNMFMFIKRLYLFICELCIYISSAHFNLRWLHFFSYWFVKTIYLLKIITLCIIYGKHWFFPQFENIFYIFIAFIFTYIYKLINWYFLYGQIYSSYLSFLVLCWKSLFFFFLKLAPCIALEPNTGLEPMN